MLIACPKCHRQYDVGSYPEGSRVRCLCGNLCLVGKPRARQVEMLHCSSCGGRLVSSKQACEYCSAEIKLADRGLGPACPECFATTLRDASFCSTCGTRIAPESILRALVDRPCPGCKEPLTECEGAAVRYVECATCGGLWLDEELFERIARDKDGAVALAVKGTLPAPASVTAPTGAAVGYRPCPVCGELMNRRNFAACSGIVLDWCRGHGWWFDVDELARALAFLEQGGMERSRTLTHERRLQEIRREKMRVEQAPMPLPPDTFGRPRWGMFEGLVDLLLS